MESKGEVAQCLPHSNSAITVIFYWRAGGGGSGYRDSLHSPVLQEEQAQTPSLHSANSSHYSALLGVEGSVMHQIESGPLRVLEGPLRSQSPWDMACLCQGNGHPSARGSIGTWGIPLYHLHHRCPPGLTLGPNTGMGREGKMRILEDFLKEENGES